MTNLFPLADLPLSFVLFLKKKNILNVCGCVLVLNFLCPCDFLSVSLQKPKENKEQKKVQLC